MHIKVLKDLSHGEGQAHALREKRRMERSAGALACHTRMREGSPRNLSTETKNVHSPKGHGRLLSRSRHGEGQALALR